jgi:hypothetical protein
VLTQNQSTHTLLLPVLFSKLKYLPPVEVIYDCYDILQPLRVIKPINPVSPLLPEPTVRPVAFVASEDDCEEEIESARALHDLAVEAYEQQQEQYDNKSSPAWEKYDAAVREFGYEMMVNRADWGKYHAFKRQKQEERRVNEIVCVWRYGTYTPSLCSAGGPNLFGHDVRKNHFPDSYIEVGEEGSKKKRMCITDVTEAYGMLQYENCRKRWEAIFKHQAKHSGPVPAHNKKNPGTHAFKAKWSDDGQGSGSGWGPEAYEAFDVWLDKINFWRKEEVRTNHKRWAFAQAAWEKDLNKEDDECEKDLDKEDDESEDDDSSHADE